MKMEWKLFCTVTMETYFIEANTLWEAKKNLAAQLNLPLECIDDYR
ncbi:hypothetical protein [Robinsoniella peoriensis]|nr:hypothetical protein [Clostridiales bacterium]